MNANEVKVLCEQIHNAEHWNLGATSTRDHRNAFWARAIGCVHHGHPIYNKTGADPQWCLKKASPTNPQSDDVAAIGTPSPGSPYLSRDAWDFIPGAGGGVYSPNPAPGSGNYWFETHYIGQLPQPQVVYAPPVPADGGNPVPVPPQPQPPATPCDQLFPPRNEALTFFGSLNSFYAQKGRPNMALPEYPAFHVDMEGVSVWYAEYLRLRVSGQSHVDATNNTLAQVEAAWPK